MIASNDIRLTANLMRDAGFDLRVGTGSCVNGTVSLKNEIGPSDIERSYSEVTVPFDTIMVSSSGGWDNTFSNRVDKRGVIDDNFFPHYLPLILRYEIGKENEDSLAIVNMRYYKENDLIVCVSKTGKYTYVMARLSVSARFIKESGPLMDRPHVCTTNEMPFISPCSTIRWNETQSDQTLSRYGVTQLSSS